MCLLAICSSSLEKRLFWSSAIFSIELFGGFVVVVAAAAVKLHELLIYFGNI